MGRRCVVYSLVRFQLWSWFPKCCKTCVKVLVVPQSGEANTPTCKHFSHMRVTPCKCESVGVYDRFTDWSPLCKASL